MVYEIILIFGISMLSTYLPKITELSMDNEINTKIIFDFDDQNQIDNWISINDNVMGGNSVGKILISDSCLLFTGNLSLENNGGFSSIRTKPRNYDLIDFHGLKIQVKGDGRTYQFRIRTNDKFDGIAYSFEFNTIEDTWIEVELPFESFLPTFRGRVLNDRT